MEKFGKMWKCLEKLPFFRADMAGLGKYCTGGFDRIGVYKFKGSRYGSRWVCNVFRYHHVGIGNAKLSSWGSQPMQGTNANV